ncbi:MAG: GTP cyclohydrolase II [Acidimicrobiia bacterium]
MSFAPIERVVQALRQGELIVLVDDPSRENEGDLVVAAEHATPEAVNFMASHGRGLVCVPMLPERLVELRLPLMVREASPGERYHTDFTVSVDYRGTTTGISAHERAATIRALIDPTTRPDDLRRPGHVFPIRSAPGGVLARAGHTEASLELARAAGLYPAAVICEIMGRDGSMARLPELGRFAHRHGLLLATIADVVRHRLWEEPVVRRVAEAGIPTELGDFRALGYQGLEDAGQHLALVKGRVSGSSRVLVRVHSECLTGDVFGSLRCDCGTQLEEALRRMAGVERGVIVYTRGHEGRGIGLLHKLAAYSLQESGRDTVEANEDLGLPPDARDYRIAAAILRDLEVRSVRLLTNNPAKLADLEAHGMPVVERVALEIPPTSHNRSYLETKLRKLGHLLNLEGT